MSYSNRKYNNVGARTVTTVYDVDKAAPLDTRVVVKEKNDLIDLNTWGSYNSTLGEDQIYIYKGMLVAVVDDATPSNNGVYMLIGATTDTTDVSYNNYQYWRKIDAPVDDVTTNINYNGEVHVKKVDGGEFTSGEWDESAEEDTYIND